MVVTIRSGEDVPDAITALWKDGLGERFDLGPLERPDAVRLAESLVDDALDPVTEEWLWRISAGNPLYLGELVRGGLKIEWAALCYRNVEPVRTGGGNAAAGGAYDAATTRPTPEGADFSGPARVW